jgi:PKD repeat protein
VRGQPAGGGGGGFGRGGALFQRRNGPPVPPAGPGTYTVTLTVGDQNLTQQLEVARSSTAPAR